MRIGAPYVAFATTFRAFLRRKKFASPSDFYRDLVENMGVKNAPSLSSVWMAFYGARAFPIQAVVFMIDRYGFEVDWRDVMPIRNLDGTTTKTNQLSLPGMREIKR